MMEYGIWLSYNNQEEGFQLPVNPPEISLSDGGKGKTYEIAKLGEINVIKSPKLTEYSFEGIFPAEEYPFVIGKPDPPKHYVDMILKWMNTKRPIRFVFSGKTFDINEAVSIEQFMWKEVAGTPGDIEYSIAFRKYVFYAARHVTIASIAGDDQTQVLQKEPAERPNDKLPPSTYTIVAGDSLSKVAKSQLGDESRWKEIQQLNGITDAEIKKLPIGKVLKLPEVTRIA